MRHAPWLLLAVCAAPSVAAEQAIDLTIAAGKAGEVCMPLKAGDTLAWRFVASAPVAFNLHDHVGAQVNMPVKRQAARHQARFKVPRSNDWCLMWTAPAAAGVTVRGAWQAATAAVKK